MKKHIGLIIIGILLILGIVLAYIFATPPKETQEQSFNITDSDFYKKYANTSGENIDGDTGYIGDNYYQKYLHYNEGERLPDKEAAHIYLSNGEIVERELE